MSIVTPDMTAALRTNIQAIFNQGLGEKAAKYDFWKKIATVFNSIGDKEEYNWLGQVPSLKEWTDQRKLSGLKPHSYTLTNRDWESTIEVHKNALADDKLGQIPTRVRQLVNAYYRGIIREVFSLLDYGATGTAFDATAFFSTTRTIGGSANIDNLITGSYSGSAAEVRAALSVVAQKFAAFTDENGEYLGVMPDLIVCSPKMQPIIQEAIRPDYAGAQRPEAQYVKEIITSPWIDADADDWYSLCTTEEVKPIIFQNRQNPEVTNLDKPDSHDAFMKKLLYYGVDARFEVGYGDPRTAVKVVDS
jgi:phage major head subunit gpT-like protein